MKDADPVFRSSHASSYFDSMFASWLSRAQQQAVNSNMEHPPDQVIRKHFKLNKITTVHLINSSIESVSDIGRYVQPMDRYQIGSEKPGSAHL